MNQTVISTVIEVILKVPLEYLAKTDSVDQGRVVQWELSQGNTFELILEGKENYCLPGRKKKGISCKEKA